MKGVAKRGAQSALLAFAFMLFACGSRSPLSLPSGSGAAAAGAGGTAGSGGSNPLEDPCPSAIAGPAAMWRNCSTRDGRARVPAPVNPQLKWTRQVSTFGSGQLSPGALTTGASSDVYVVSGHKASSQGAIQRRRSNAGAVQWTVEIDTVDATIWPVVLSAGLVDVFVRAEPFAETLLQIDAQSGDFTPTTFGFDFYTVPRNPAVGADGSLYLVHRENVGTANSATFISRVHPGGVVAWTTPKLDDLVFTGNETKLQLASTLALGGGGEVIAVVGSLGPSGVGSIGVALDPETGAMLWQTDLSGQRLGGPAVRPDGSIVVLLGPLTGSKMVTLDAQSGTPTTFELSFGAGEIFASEVFAITRAGTAIVGINAGEGISDLAAVDRDGNVRWTQAVPARRASLASNGTLVVAAKALVAFDEESGAMRWQVSPPSAGSCLLDAALTSDGDVVALQCDGTLFAVGD